MSADTSTQNEQMEASFSMLAMSIASTAVISMGLTPDPQTGQTHIDKNLARFNIDLLAMLKEKTKNNLTAEESQFITQILQDLQMKYLQLK